MTTAKERFAVSHLGMREFHQGRDAAELMKELIQNAWDEAPDCTMCTVTIQPQGLTGNTLITVEDNGPGFANIEDAYTLMGNTAERADPKKRGRFNLGEKEFISVAVHAKIETAGHTVNFPEKGGRTVSKNKRPSGTKITALMPWTEEESHDLTKRLWIFRPSDCGLTVNGTVVPRREPVKIGRAVLETVLQDHIGAPMRKTRRTTDYHVLEGLMPGESWIYEMGIPIQQIETPFDIDVQQKVPMPPNRTEVPARYISAIYAEALNLMNQEMEEADFGAGWVKTAIEEPRASAESVRETIRGRYGPKVLLISNDSDANLEAQERGYELINPRSLSQTERDRFKGDGAMKTTKDVFPSPDLSNPVPVEQDDAKAAFGAWIKEIGLACNLNVTVEYINNPTFKRKADCSMGKTNPTLRLNTADLSDSLFLPPYNREDQLELVIHEFGHAIGDLKLKHGPRWGRGVAKAAGLVGQYLARK